LSSLKNFLNQFFKKQPKEFAIPFVHEVYDFDLTSDEFVLWKGGKKHLALSQMIINSYVSFQNDLEYSRGITFMDNQKIAGVVVNPSHFELDKGDYIHFCSFLIENLLDKGYVLQLSEIKSLSTSGTINQRIKAYLKPSRKMVKGGKNEQLYGNVLMEIGSVKRSLNQFKISCSYYQDQHFHNPMGFELFLEDIINS